MIFDIFFLIFSIFNFFSMLVFLQSASSSGRPHNLCYVFLLTPYSFYHGYRIKNYTTNIYNITFINFYTIVIFPNKIFIRNIFFTFNPDMSRRFIKDFFPYNWEKLIHQKNTNVS